MVHELKRKKNLPTEAPLKFPSLPEGMVVGTMSKLGEDLCKIDEENDNKLEKRQWWKLTREKQVQRVIRRNKSKIWLFQK